MSLDTMLSSEDKNMSLMSIFLIFIIVYFLLIRPRTKKQKEHQKMPDNLVPPQSEIDKGTEQGLKQLLSKYEEIKSLKKKFIKSSIISIIILGMVCLGCLEIIQKYLMSKMNMSNDAALLPPIIGILLLSIFIVLLMSMLYKKTSRGINEKELKNNILNFPGSHKGCLKCYEVKEKVILFKKEPICFECAGKLLKKLKKNAWISLIVGVYFLYRSYTNMVAVIIFVILFVVPAIKGFINADALEIDIESNQKQLSAYEQEKSQ